MAQIVLATARNALGNMALSARTYPPMNALPLYAPVKQIVVQFGLSRATVHRKLSVGIFHGQMADASR